MNLVELLQSMMWPLPTAISKSWHAVIEGISRSSRIAVRHLILNLIPDLDARFFMED